MAEFIRDAYLLLLLLLLVCGVAKALLQPDGVRLTIGEEVLLEFQSNNYKTYKHLSTNNSETSVTVAACSAPIEWNVFQSAIGVNSTWILLHSSISNDRETYEFPPQKSVFAPIEYTIKLKTNVAGYGSIVTTNISRLNSLKKVGLQMKWKRESDLVLRWHKHHRKSAENYCVVITTGKQHTNLCSALTSDEYKHLKNTTGKQLAASFIENVMSSNEQLVYCTNTNLLKLNVDQLLDQSRNKSTSAHRISAALFGFDQNSSIPQHIASNETFSVRPTVTMKENKLTFIKLTNGPVTLSLKVLQRSFANSLLDLYVVPCDARLFLDVDVAFNGNPLAARKDIVGFGKLSVPNVQLKKPYVITVSPRQSNSSVSVLREVQVFATTLSSAFNPFPEMPRLPATKEYRTLRTCNSVTVGWIPPNGLRTATYCMVVKQGKADRLRFQGNQCRMHGQMRRGRVSPNDVAKMCKQLQHTARISVLTQKIDKLKPGTFYHVQIMVRKPKGRMLSYETLQVRTKSKC